MDEERLRELKDFVDDHLEKHSIPVVWDTRDKLIECLDEIRRQRAALKKIEGWADEALHDEIKVLRDALAFYADPKIYTLQPPFTSGLPCINFDKGKIARRTLGIDGQTWEE